MGVHRCGVAHGALAGTLGCMALLVCVPGAMAAGGGAIEGTVTEAASSEGTVPLQGIPVAVFDANTGLYMGFASTDAKGKYTVEGLPGGSYKVQFAGPFDGEAEAEPLAFAGREISVERPDFITQYYKDEPSYAAADPVAVVQGRITEGIDAELRRGGEIEGTVTDAATHAPIPEAVAIALASAKVAAGAAETEANGHYTIVGLPSGSYAVEFFTVRVPYQAQFYNNQPTFASANLVPVIAPRTVTGIDAALAPDRPLDSAAPEVTVASAKLRASKRSVRVLLKCAHTVCAGTVELVTRARAPRRGRGRHRGGAKTVVVARGSYALAAGQNDAIALRLTAAGRRTLAGARRHRLTVTVLVTLTSGHAIRRVAALG